MKRVVAYLAAVAGAVGLGGCGDMLKDATITVPAPFTVSVDMPQALSGTTLTFSKTLDPASTSAFQNNKSKLKDATLTDIKLKIDQLKDGNLATKINGATVTVEDASTHEKHTYALADQIAISAGAERTFTTFPETGAAAGQAKDITTFVSGILKRESGNSFTISIDGTTDQGPIFLQLTLTLDVDMTVSAT
jgi:hypothetical protein